MRIYTAQMPGVLGPIFYMALHPITNPISREDFRIAVMSGGPAWRASIYGAGQRGFLLFIGPDGMGEYPPGEWGDLDADQWAINWLLEGEPDDE